MGYRKINIELVVFPEDAVAVVSALNLVLDRLEETYEIFGGAIETTPVKHSGGRRKSALKHTLDAGNAATSAVKSAAQKVADTYKKIVWHPIRSKNSCFLDSNSDYDLKDAVLRKESLNGRSEKAAQSKVGSNEANISNQSQQE